MFAHHFIPSTDDTLHVEVTREESDYSVRYSFAILDEESTEVSNDGGIISNFKS